MIDVLTHRWGTSIYHENALIFVVLQANLFSPMQSASGKFLLLNLIVLLMCAQAGCTSILDCSIRPGDLHFDAIPESRSTQIQIDHRLLGTPIDAEHTVTKGDVLGIYIADVLGLSLIHI